jgi:deoxyribose-phosphate aldolase
MKTHDSGLGSICKHLEYTNLSREITQAQVDQMLEQAHRFQFLGICLPPYWVKKAARDKKGELIIVTVVGFPFGYELSQTKVAQTQAMIDVGAQEIDLVMNLSAFKSGAAQEWVKPEVAQIAKICHQNQVLLKLIIETSALNEQEIALACKLGSDAGADFIKSSTGVGSLPIDAQTIALMRKSTAPSLGIKASSGINSLEKAWGLVAAGAERLGSSKAVEIALQEQAQ